MSSIIFILICILIISSVCANTLLDPSDHSDEADKGVTCAGTMNTEGDIIVRSNGIREVFGAAGQGIKVGVIGNGAESLMLSQQRGELGSVNVYNLGSGDEGTAMMEIIHDLAPDAELYFDAYGNNSSDFKKAVTTLAGAGCRIICDDLYFFHQPFMEDGDVAEHIRSVLRDHPDLIYITVSGNFAPLHYQGSWKPGSSIGPEQTFHDFGNGNSAIHMDLQPGDEVIVTLQWDDPWGKATTDYDLFLTDPQRGVVLATSTNVQNGAEDPFEHLVYKQSGTQPQLVSLSIVRNGENSTPNLLEMFIRNISPSQVEEQVVKDPYDSIFGHAAVPEVITVGSVGISTPFDISPDSSRGPVTIRNPEPAIRFKPDICAPTNVQVSGAGSFPVPFPGTSAAAPHVAGVIAQILGNFPDVPRDDIKKAIYSSAVDLGASGWDDTYGYGLIDAVRTYQYLYEDYKPSKTELAIVNSTMNNTSY